VQGMGSASDDQWCPVKEAGFSTRRRVENPPSLHCDVAIWKLALPFLLHPPISKRAETRERFAVLLSIGRGFTGDDIVGMADWKTFDFHAAFPGIGKSLDPVGSEDQVEIKWAILELDEVFATLDLCDLRRRKRKTELL